MEDLMKVINAKLVEKLGELGGKQIPVELFYICCIIAAGALIACIFNINQINGLSKQITDLATEISKLAGGAIGG
jgi:hypothetical protein